MAEQVKLDEVGKAILKALAQCKDPAGCGEIAVKAGLPTPKVTGKMRGLLKGGCVATPLKGKYVLTKEGKRYAE
ncbi:MAG TPA: helix-turn-helix domain-containing protein [Candidatus Tectomicrobia bacterium]